MHQRKHLLPMLRTIQGRSIIIWSKLVALIWLATTTWLFGNGTDTLFFKCFCCCAAQLHGNVRGHFHGMFSALHEQRLFRQLRKFWKLKWRTMPRCSSALIRRLLSTVRACPILAKATIPFSSTLYVQPGASGLFSINITLDCDVASGQSHCVEAQAFPNSTCDPVPPIWDGSRH